MEDVEIETWEVGDPVLFTIKREGLRFSVTDPAGRETQPNLEIDDLIRYMANIIHNQNYLLSKNT